MAGFVSHANYSYWPINGCASIDVNFQRRAQRLPLSLPPLRLLSPLDPPPEHFAIPSPQLETYANHPRDIYRRNASHLLLVSYRERSPLFFPDRATPILPR